MLKGTFYGIGVGPGENGLLTVRAVEILRKTEVLCVPGRAAGAESRALSIARPYLEPHVPVTELVFPMSRDSAVLEQHWLAAARQVAELLAEHEAVSFVTIGDPLTYSTCGYLLSYLRRMHPEVKTEIVPGVTSFQAAAALLRLPLVEGDERLALVTAPLEQEELAELLRRFATIVILKVSAAFDHTLDLLRQEKDALDIYLVKACGSGEEFYTADPFALYGQQVEYLSLLIVRRRGSL